MISNPHEMTRNRKLTPAEKAKEKERQKEYMTVFINGKQKRIKRPQTIDGMSVDEFIIRNADPIWLHQNEMWEYMIEEDDLFEKAKSNEEKQIEDKIVPSHSKFEN